jgi:hypothetical protein
MKATEETGVTVISLCQTDKWKESIIVGDLKETNKNALVKQN